MTSICSPDSAVYRYIQDRMPLIYVFMSGVGFSIQALVIKLLAEHGFHGSFFCVLMRGITQGIIASIFIYNDEDRLKPDGQPLFGNSSFIKMMLFLRAVIGYGSIACSFLAAEYIAIGDSTVLIMLSPMIASIASYFILGESWRWPEFVATFLSLAGAVLVAKPPILFGTNDDSSITPHDMFLGVTLGLSAALFAGFAFVCVRILGTSAKMPWANVCFSQALAQIVLSVPNQYIAGQKFEDIFTITPYEGGLIFLGGFIGAWSQISMTLGMQREKSATATAMRMSDVIFGFIWQILFTQDPISYLSVLGALLVTGSIMVVVVFKQSSTETTAKEAKKVIRPEVELTDMDSSTHNILHPSSEYQQIEDENLDDEYWFEDEEGNDIEAKMKKIAAYLDNEGVGADKVLNASNTSTSAISRLVATSQISEEGLSSGQTEHSWTVKSPGDKSNIQIKSIDDIMISPVLSNKVEMKSTNGSHTHYSAQKASNNGEYARLDEATEDLETSTHEINLTYNELPYSDEEENVEKV